jgi:hypothetical protein
MSRWGFWPFRRRRLAGGLRWLGWSAGALAIAVGLVAVLAILADVLLDEPLRAQMERRLNERLQGYQVIVRALDFHVVGFSIDLLDVVVSQSAYPDPPVAWLPRLSAGVQWRALLRARLVADIAFERPELYINRQQLLAEARDPVPAKDKGWQEALQSLYPFKINYIMVTDAKLNYVDSAAARPLFMWQVNLKVDDIRNIRSAERTYPSEIALDAMVFDAGRLRLRGNADFLAVPHAGVRGEVELEGVPLDYFQPIAARYNVRLNRGTFAATGLLEYAPTVKTVHVREMSVQELRVDYVHRAETARAERKRAENIQEAAAEASNAPGLLLRIDRARVTDAVVGFVNEAAQPRYRVFLADAALEVENLSNHRTEGAAVVSLRGRFMGSGPTIARATFRPERKGADFDLAVKIEGTDVRSMNDLFRAYGGFDTADGLFSLVAELSVQNRTVVGYIKPLFQNLDVYDRRQDRGKNPVRQLYEAVIGGIAQLLENRPREEVATKADVWGRLEDPQTSTVQIAIGLIQNAFFKAILPRFERDMALARKR